MSKFAICCGSLCGFCGKVLRAKASLRALMFLCLFWTTFNIVLSSMTVTPLLQIDETRVINNLKCSPSELCNGCQDYIRPPRPCLMTVSTPTPDNVVAIRLSCPWPIGANASRFCCALCCIIMFTGILIRAFRQPNSKHSKWLYVVPFIAADVWWWAIMFTDATEITNSNDQCNVKKQIFFISLPASWPVSVRISQRILCSRSFLTSCIAVSHTQPFHLHCSMRRRVRPLFLDPLDLCMHVLNPPPPISLRTLLTFV
jgi:hypothetical protein